MAILDVPKKGRAKRTQAIKKVWIPRTEEIIGRKFTDEEVANLRFLQVNWEVSSDMLW